MSDFEPGVQSTERDHLIGVVADAMRAAEPNEAAHLPLDHLKYEEAAAVAVDAVLGEKVTPTYQYQVFDTKRSRVVLEIPVEDLPEVQEDMKDHTARRMGWVLRRRVVGEWEDVK